MNGYQDIWVGYYFPQELLLAWFLETKPDLGSLPIWNLGDVVFPLRERSLTMLLFADLGIRTEKERDRYGFRTA